MVIQLYVAENAQLFEPGKLIINDSEILAHKTGDIIVKRAAVVNVISM